MELSSLNARAGTVYATQPDSPGGGLKQRALRPFLAELMEEGCTEFVYASPCAGSAREALVETGMALGARVTIICEASLEQAERAAQAYASEDWERCKLPLGFADRRYARHLEREVARALARIGEELGGVPRSIWLPVGSGTLARAFSQAAPAGTRLRCVDVRMLGARDLRISCLRGLAGIELSAAPERHAERARVPAPVPADACNDAKVWRFVHERAEAGDLWAVSDAGRP